MGLLLFVSLSIIVVVVFSFDNLFLGFVLAFLVFPHIYQVVDFIKLWLISDNGVAK